MSMNNPEPYIKHPLTRDGTVDFLNEIKYKLNWNEKERVLDVGCGPGDVTRLLFSYLPDNSHIVGCDISEKMIEYAKENYSTNCISYRPVDITDNNIWSTWKKEEFTKIFSFYCLQRVDNQRKAYENIYKLMTPGGDLIALLVNDFFWLGVHRYLANLPKYSHYKQQLLSVIPDESFPTKTVELLRNIGFDIKYNKVATKNYLFKTFDDAYEYFETISYLPYILSEHMIDEIKSDIKKSINEMQVLECTNDGCLLKYVSHTFIARKPRALK